MRAEVSLVVVVAAAAVVGPRPALGDRYWRACGPLSAAPAAALQERGVAGCSAPSVGLRAGGGRSGGGRERGSLVARRPRRLDLASGPSPPPRRAEPVPLPWAAPALCQVVLCTVRPSVVACAVLPSLPELPCTWSLLRELSPRLDKQRFPH